MDDSDELSAHIIQKIADRENTNPEDLSPPLYSVIDPDSLDNLFRNAPASVTFEYLGYQVEVNHLGEITIQ